MQLNGESVVTKRGRFGQLSYYVMGKSLINVFLLIQYLLKNYYQSYILPLRK